MIQEELTPGTTVLEGRYEVIACMGVGGSASVYRARDRDGREVALKVLLAARARSPYEVKRLEREFHLGRSLRDIDGVIPALELGTLAELDHRPFIRFPFLDGEELDYKLTGGPLPPLQASTVLVKLARVVARVHQAGVLHRDIKPSNVMLGRDGTVSLLDFGHARRIEDSLHSSASDLTRAHELPGTRHYMAPEQALGGQPSASWDIYAMGMTLYEALVGDCAYSDLSARESLQRRCKPDAKPLSVRKRRPSLPAPLADFVDRCLAYAPEARPQTAAAFADEIEALDLDAREDNPTRQVSKRPRTPRSGMQVGPFSLHSRLGQGGCATVYSAYDTRSGTTVALKVLIERYKGRPEREVLLEQEAEALRRIGPHPHIVRMIEHGRLPDLDWPYLALEMIRGESVRELILEGATPARRVTDIAMQVALALREAHRAGVIHRDLTPSNVLLDHDGKRAVLIDFSHCAWSDSPRVPAGHPARLTRHGEVAGSSQAMSPEQARSAPATAAMDVYAFGVLLFQMLTARAPFPEYGDRDIFIALQSRDRLAPPLLSASDFPEAPPQLIDLVNACVQLEGSERPSLAFIIRTLEQALASMAMPAPAMTEVFEAPASLVEAPREPDAPVRPPSPPAPPADITPSRTLPYALLSAAGALLLLALVKLGLSTDAPSSSLAPAPPRPPSQAALVSPEPRFPEPPGPTPTATAETLPLKEPPSVPAPSARPTPKSRPSAPQVPPTAEPLQDPPPSQKPPPIESQKERCSGHSKQAQAATKRQDWKGVLRSTKNAACWSDQHERQRLRLAALRNAGKYEACVKLATKTGDHRTAKFCNKRLPPSP
mgnify:CR=1 FL=1